jgi:hypothetical protein
MTNQIHDCERTCKFPEPVSNTEFIVLTGGPGAGKTAVLEFVRKILCQRVAILPESAGILFSGGFWRLNSIAAKKAAQKAIYHVQNEMQNLVLSEKKWSIALCDRGTLDGLAYWPNSEKTFFDELRTNRESEYKKYKAVIHLASPSLEHGYNYQNPFRIESADLAAQIDERIFLAWKDHPNYYAIDSTTNFAEKMDEAIKQIQLFLPTCCNEHIKERAQ